MANPQKPVGAGGYYSGTNPIPTIQQFIENLDSSKNLRDQEIDEVQKGPPAQQQQKTTTNGSNTPQLIAKKHQKIVTDPVSGKEVVIEHAKRGVVDDVRDPKLSIPNANLGKETVRRIVYSRNP
jgi:hypothetical protein